MITRVALRVRPRRDAAFDGWTVGSFLEGVELLRRLEQDGLAPDIARLSDEEETRLSVALSGTGAVGRKLLGGRCLLVCGWQGSHGRAAAAALLVRGGARPLGPKPGRAWEASRFAGPHLRDDLLDRGVLVETLETATSWSNLPRLYDAVRAALPGLHVGCHVSHLYPTGASLYFTVLGRQNADPVAQWRAAKDAATRAIDRRRRHDHPPPRDRPRPRALPRRRDRRARPRTPAHAQDPLRPGRDHEPRQAARLLAGGCGKLAAEDHDAGLLGALVVLRDEHGVVGREPLRELVDVVVARARRRSSSPFSPTGSLMSPINCAVPSSLLNHSE